MPVNVSMGGSGRTTKKKKSSGNVAFDALTSLQKKSDVSKNKQNLQKSVAAVKKPVDTSAWRPPGYSDKPKKTSAVTGADVEKEKVAAKKKPVKKKPKKDTSKAVTGSDIDKEKEIQRRDTVAWRPPGYGEPTTPTVPITTPEVERIPGKSSWELAGFPSREAFQKQMAENRVTTSAKNKAETERRIAEDPNFKTFEQEFAEKYGPKDELPLLPEIPEFIPPPVAAQGPSEADIRQQLIDANVAENIRGLEDVFRKTTGALEASEAGLEERFRGQRGDIREQDIMEREATRKLQAQRNLANAGAVGQSDISQKVITMGALSQSAAQEENIRADIQNQLVEAKAALSSGIAGAENQGRVFALTEQLRDIQEQKARDLAKVELGDQRDYDMFIRELDKADDDELRVIEDEINRKNEGYRSQLRIAEANNDFTNAKQLRAIIDSNTLKLEEVRTSNDLLINAQKQRLEDESYEKRLKEEDQGFDTGVFEDGINRAIESILVDPATGQRNQTQVKASASQFLVDNAKHIRNDAQLDELMILYGLSKDDIDSLLGQQTQSGTGLGPLGYNY